MKNKFSWGNFEQSHDMLILRYMRGVGKTRVSYNGMSDNRVSVIVYIEFSFLLYVA